MRRIIGLIFALLLLLPADPPILAGELSLTILHTNDVHSRLAATPPFGAECNAEHVSENKCLGGAARLSGAINAIRAEGGHTVLLDAGDQFQGSLFFTYYSGQAAAQVMNGLGYDAMALGNHEFDGGPETLSRFAERIDFPLLAANMDVSTDRHLAGHVAPWTVLEFGGERIGVVGLITEETPSISSPGPDI